MTPRSDEQTEEPEPEQPGPLALLVHVNSRPGDLNVLRLSIMPQRMRVALPLFATILGISMSSIAFALQPPDISRILDKLESDDPSRQLEAAKSLARIVQDLREAAPQLERLIESEASDVRLAGVRALWMIRGKSKTHIPLLVRGLHDKEPHNRADAAELLGQLGPQAGSTVPSLAKLLTDKNADVRIAGASALGEIGPSAESAIAHLRDALMDEGKSSHTPIHLPSFTVSDAAALALKSIGSAAIPAIAPLLKHDNKRVRINAMWVLAGGGETSRPYVPVLLKSLRDDDVSVRHAAAQILGELRIAPMDSVRELAALLKDKDKNIRFWSAASLARYGPQAEIALSELIAALQDKHPGVRARAADAIGEIGPAAKNALPHLKPLREDRNFFFYPHSAKDSVRPHALKAIAKIRKSLKPMSNDK